MSGRNGRAARGKRLFAWSLLVQMLLEYVQSVPVVVLHADCTQDRTHGARGTSLFTNDFPYISRSNTQPQHSTLFAVHCFHDYRLRVIHQSLRDLGD